MKWYDIDNSSSIPVGRNSGDRRKVAAMKMSINGIIFYGIPYTCGSCPAFIAGTNDKGGFCSLFSLQKWRYNDVPARCKKLFEKGFQIGGNLVITVNE